MTRRVRVVLVVVGVVAGLFLIAALVVRSLLSPQRFTGILQQAVADVGLVLELRGDAEPDLFPRPAVELHGVRLRLPGQPLLLSANRVRLVVPWNSLLGGAPAITRLEVAAPQVDLAQLQQWLGQLPATGQTGAPALPDIGVGVNIRDGRLVSGDQLLLARIGVDVGSLHLGQRFALDAEAETPGGVPLQLHLTVFPLQDQGRVRLDDLTLQLGSGESSRLVLGGDMTWRGGTRLSGELDGQLEHADTSYAVGLNFTPQPAMDRLALAVRVNNDTTHMALRLSPQEAVAWWQNISDPERSQLSMPPVIGNVAAQELDLGSMHVEGLRIESTPAESAPASSRPNPARAESAGSTRTAASSAATEPV